MRFKLCVLFWILSFGCLISQTIPCKNITVNDGLPSNGIKCFYKDSRGYLWIGTDAGLCRYDGRNYKVYNENNGLKYKQVWSIVEDEQNNLWLSVYGHGLAKFDGKTFSYFNEKNGLVNNNIRKIHYSKKYNCLILATENGLSIFNGKAFKSFEKKNGIRGFQIVGIDEYKDKIFITSSFNGVYSLKVKQPILQSYLDSLFYIKNTYSSMVDENNYYASGPEHLFFWKSNLNTNLNTISCPIIWSYAKVKNSTLFTSWNVTDPNGGLFEFKNGTLSNITQKTNITSTGLWTNFYDNKTKQLWVGSIDNGIYRVDFSDRFEQFKPSYFGMKELKIQELFLDKNSSIWIGAKDNIILIKKGEKPIILTKEILNQKLEKYSKNHSLIFWEHPMNKQTKIKDGFTSFNIVTDNEGLTWVNTTWGMFCFDDKLEIKSFYGSDGGHSVFDRKDQLYYGHMYGHMHLIPNKFDRTKHKEFTNKDSNSPTDITKITKQGDFIWFGTNTNGLFLLKDGIFTSLLLKGKFEESSIKELVINENNELMIGTNSGVVYVARWKENNFEILYRFKPNKEIIGSTISFIEYVKGTYFIGTNKGINIIKNNKFVQLLNKFEGLEDIQLNDCVQDKNGNLWIGTNNGLIKFNTSSYIKKKSKSKLEKIQITKLIVNGNTYENKLSSNWGFIYENTFKLSYNQNDIQLFYSAINTFNSKKHLYRYKIEGLSKFWSEYSSDGKIQLFGIPSGKYTIYLEGKNIGSGVQFQLKKISLIITPPFWKTTWFISFIIIFIVLLTYLYVKNRIKRIEKREREKSQVTNKLIETKLEALRAQMNPHFTFNAMNSIQNFIIDNNTAQALHYLGEFSKLIRQTLENASEKLMSINTELRFLESYLNVQKMRFDKVQTNIKLDSNIDKYRTKVPPLILQPFIENAFEHAFNNDIQKEQIIDIHLFVENDLLVCIIKDNGTGFVDGRSNTLHKSFGQKLTKDRLDLFNKEYNTKAFNLIIINLMENGGTGTEVKITFPLILE